MLLGAGLYFGAPRLDHLSTRQLRWGIGLGLLAMLIAQVVVLHVMPNTVYHDPYRVLSQADQLAAGHMTWDITYSGATPIRADWLICSPCGCG
ncbi:hypothetical protein N624_2836 [Levilactobacillus brevis]|nr:hypothetical protein N624_2836 [Levilactobacillus brevis]